MKKEQLNEALSFLDPDLITEAASTAPAENDRKKRRRWLSVGLSAACFILAVCIGFRFAADPPELPKLTVEPFEVAMGFEGYMAYDISELTNANPWSENLKLDKLPVFQNPSAYDPEQPLKAPDFKQMRTLLLDTADRLGLDEDALTITDNTLDEETTRAIIEKFESVGDKVPEGYFEPSTLIAEANGIKIEVDKTMTVEIWFDPAVSLPDGYRFTRDSTYEELSNVAEYLKGAYTDLIGMKNPQVNITGGDYTIYRKQLYSVEFFDAEKNSVDRLINYNFNRIAFYCNDEGKLYLIRIFKPDLSEKLGDYPIISAAEAQELLASGNYITSVPYEFPGEESLAKVELIYRHSSHDDCYMPYYRFYAELPELTEKDGLKTYGAYYVPAVEEKHLTEMPIWDGSFN